jgi:putative transposase
MARLPRLYAPRIPQLVQARLARPLALPGEPTPAASLDRIQGWLAEAVQDTAPLSMHAWAILPDAITLLATPGNEQILSSVMQSLGRRLGTGMRARVYSGRYHNALLEPGRWVLPVMLWVETLSVANGHVGQATQWPWSSAAEHSGLPGGSAPGSSGPSRSMSGSLASRGPVSDGPTLTDHADYWQIGDTPFARQATWRQWLAGGIGQTQRAQIEAALHGQWALGEKIFLAHLGRLASRRVTPAPRGRPRKEDQSGEESRTRRTLEYGTSRRRPER